jgi:cold-inducible RNA-binding protein
MSGAPRATMSKRQRELDQKDRAKQRDVRRQERRQRAADRAASGESGPPMGEPTPPITDFVLDDALRQVGRHPGDDPSPSTEARAQDMGNRLYVGNLSFDTTDESLRALFAEHGAVSDVHIVKDRDTGRPRGFAFVTMGTNAEAEAAIRATDGQSFEGRPLRVNEAEERQRGGGGGGGPRGFSRGGGGGGGGGGGRGRY